MTPPPRPRLAEVAAGAIDAADARILAQVASLYAEIDPVPDDLIDRVQFAITLDALHAEIAELQRSSDLAGVRSDAPTETQSITFTSASLTTMITLTVASAERTRIDGWIAPGQGVAVELRTGDGIFAQVADQDGRFVFDDVPRGWVRFVLRPPAGSAHSVVITPSIEI
jgi:hypothetical protein